MDETKLVGEGLAPPADPMQTEPGGASPSPTKGWLWALALGLPVGLNLLFEHLKSNTPLMDTWVHTYMAPVMQGVGSVFALLPFSAAEVLTVLFLAGSLFWLLRAVVRLVRERKWRRFAKRLLSFGCVLAWLWTAFCWTWNCTYYATGFADRYGLKSDPYTPEQLVNVTIFFAYQAAQLADDVPRDGALRFAEPLDACFARAPRVYDSISEQYPVLRLSDRQAKSLVFSRLQSILGYTGIYFPFTGEANVNTDQTGWLVPFTIAHEMAHQRFVAAEQECNFIGILACITSDDPVFQYSGYLMGLVYLINAVSALSPELGQEIMRQTFTDAVYVDWNDNYDYWQALKTPAREAASEAMDEVYDGYLKSQGQSLGLMSYNACVDLLVNYFA